MMIVVDVIVCKSLVVIECFWYLWVDLGDWIVINFEYYD